MAANPYLANVPDARTVDYATWKTTMAKQAATRASSTRLAAARRAATGSTPPAAVVHDEEEPAGTAGSNDSQANAEPITGFGTGRRENQRVRILGALASLAAPTVRTLPPTAEDNGSIPLSKPTGIDGTGAITTTGVLGDGPHGTTGDQTNDFDFYTVTASAGNALVVDTSGGTVDTDTIVAVYTAAGDLVAADDDSGTGFRSRLSYDVAADGTYFVLVAGYSSDGPLPEDPNDSGSGAGGAEVGPYSLAMSSSPVDHDYYALVLAAGDVIGSTATGQADGLTIYRVDGAQMVRAVGLDASSLYAPNSPLPGGGNTTLAYVAEEAGTYVIQVSGEVGAYDANVEVYRPGAEIDRASRVQTVFLDFDGARVNTGIWGGPGTRDLSPFSAFIGKWGLTRSQEGALIDKITAEVRENIRTDLIRRGLNDDVAVRVINSKDNRDIFGQENVSRVIVGGTIDQSGIPTIGIAQYIDPGNYAHVDSALVLLDVLSDPAGDAASLNTYLKASSNRADFVSQAVGNVISHEIGHMIGNYHTDNVNEVVGLMDAGGTSFDNLYGVGPDGIGGTADDSDTDFFTDRYIPAEGFDGLENTLNVAAWAFGRDRGQVAAP